MTIDLNLSADQHQIIDSVSSALSDNFPVARLRGDHTASPDGARLAGIAELGGFGLGAPEQIGGAGFTIVEEALLFIAFGRHLVTTNALAATIGARVADALGLPELAAGVISGEKIVCVANALRPFSLDGIEGLPVHLLDADAASLVLLWNDTGLLLLHAEALTSEQIRSADRSVTLRRAVLTETAVAGRISSADSTLVRQAHLLNAAQLLGMAEAIRDMAVAYATIRTQFGQPIGAFQAVKHRCADMAINAQVLHAQLIQAAIAERDAWPDAAFQNDVCRLLAGRYALQNARGNIQVHGGIGFTAECDAHLYLLRAHLCERLGAAGNAITQRLTSPPFFGFGGPDFSLQAQA